MAWRCIVIEEFLGHMPVLKGNNFVAPNATLLGDVALGEWTSVWYGTVIRGDVHWIRIGHDSNVQDNAVIHVTNHTAPTWIGNGVTIGHSAVVHGCRIADNVLVGIRSVILDLAQIGEDSIIGAGSLVPPRKVIPPRSLVVGVPGRVVRTLSDEEVADIRLYATHYRQYSAIYLGQDHPDKNPFYESDDNPFLDA